MGRRWLRGFALVAVTAALGLAVALAVAVRPPPGPDIILVVWDTCRGDRVSVNGFARGTTPSLQAFAADGVTFSRCYTASPWTPPSHASLFTGLLPVDHGLGEQSGDNIRSGIPTLATTLSKRGYRCRAFVANPMLRAFSSLTSGFESVDLVSDEDTGKGNGAEVIRRARLYLDSIGDDDPPVFLFVNLMECHLPFTFDEDAPAALGEETPLSRLREVAAETVPDRATAHNIGFQRMDPGSIPVLARAYEGAVLTTDRLTGMLFTTLGRRSRFRRGVVAVVGDHGEALGEQGKLGHVGLVTDNVLHVPLVVRWPGHLDGGRTVDAQVRVHDLHATLLEAAGVELPSKAPYDAASLAETTLRPRPVVSRFGPTRALRPGMRERLPNSEKAAFVDHRELVQAVRVQDETGCWKFRRVTRYGDDGAVTPVSEELFDLVTDPDEESDLLRRGAPAEAQALADRLRSMAGVDPSAGPVRATR